MFLFYFICWKHCESQDCSWPGFLWHIMRWRSSFPFLELLTVHSHSSVVTFFNLYCFTNSQYFLFLSSLILSLNDLFHYSPIFYEFWLFPFFLSEGSTVLAAFTTSGSLYILYPFIHMCVHKWVHKDKIIFWSFSTEAYFCIKKILNLCGNVWLAFDLISPMTVGVNYHMIFLPTFLDGVNFLLQNDLSFRK